MLRNLLSHWLNAETRHSIHSPFFSEFYKNVVSPENQSLITSLFQKSDTLNLRTCNRVLEYLDVRRVLVVGKNFTHGVLHIPDVYNFTIVPSATDDQLKFEENINVFRNSSNYSLRGSVREVFFNQHEIFDVMLWDFESGENLNNNFLLDLMGLPDPPKVMMFSNIYNSKSSKCYWQKLKESDSVFASVDLFHCGILFLGITEFTATQHYVW